MTGLLHRGHFFGRTTRQRELGGLALSDTEHAAGAEAPRHAHAHPYICLVLAGGFSERFGHRSSECGPGTVVLHPAGEEHADRFGRSGARCFNLQLDAELLERLRLGPLPGRVSVDGGRAAVAAARLRHEADERVGLIAAETVVLELLGSADGDPRGGRRDERRAPPWLGRVIDRLRAAVDGAPPRIATLAAEEGVHPVHLARTFRRHLGTTPVEYFQRLRLRRGTLALARGSATVARVAAEAGFSDHSHFCRLFKREYGLAPSAYRALLA